MKKINFNLVFIRFLAIIIVMFGHSIIIYDSNWGIYTSVNSSNILVFLKHIINYIQMPIWFSLSGFLYYFSIKKKNPFKFVLWNKFKKLIIPFFIVGLFYFIPIRYIISNQNFINNSLTYNIYHNLILGFDNGHLWFLPTLFLMFLLFYFYKVNNKFIDIFTFFILVVLNIMSHKLSIYFSTYLINVFVYSVFFFIGILFNKYNIKNTYNPYCLLIIFVILIIYNIFNSNAIILLFIQLFVLIILFKIDFAKLTDIKIINNISNNSYGMYLFHSPLIYFTFKYLPNIPPLFMIIINFFIFGFISYLIPTILRKTKLKFIIGE